MNNDKKTNNNIVDTCQECCDHEDREYYADDPRVEEYFDKLYLEKCPWDDYDENEQALMRAAKLEEISYPL